MGARKNAHARRRRARPFFLASIYFLAPATQAKKSSSSSPVNYKPPPTCSLFCVFFENIWHLLIFLYRVSPYQLLLTPGQCAWCHPQRNAYWVGLIHFWTWLQKGLLQSPCWVFSIGRAHSMCTCSGIYPSPLTKFSCKLTCTLSQFCT